MRFPVSVFALLALAASVVAAPAPAPAPATTTPISKKPCYAAQTGYFGVKKRFGLDAHHRLVPSKYGVVAEFKVDFQACPATGWYHPDLANGTNPTYQGRIVLHNSSFVGSDTCLTAVAPANTTTSSPYNGTGWTVKALKCEGDGVTVPKRQRWVYGNDFGGGIFWAGCARCGRTDAGEGGWQRTASSRRS